MVDQSKLAEIAIAAIDATARPNAWGDLCDRIAGVIGAKGLFVNVYDGNSQAMPHVIGSAICETPAAREIIAALRNGAGAEDIRLYEAIARQPAGRVMGEHELYGIATDKPLPANSLRDAMLAVTGGRARCLMKLNDIGPFLDCVAVHDGAPHDDIPSFALVAPIFHPIIARTLETTRIVNAMAESYARLMSLFDRLDFGVAFCASDSRVITSNVSFRSISRERDGLYVEAGRLCTGTKTANQALRTMLASATLPNSTPEELTVSLPRRSGRLPLVLCSVPVRNSDLGLATAAMLLVIDPEDRTRLSARGLSALGVLSPAEIDVCELLVRGYETKQIAEIRGTQLTTTRDQVKSSSAKLFCRSRLDIVRLAMITKAPLLTEKF